MRTEALEQVYGELIENILWENEEPRFIVNSDTIHYAGGRLLLSSRLAEKGTYESLWYPYIPGKLTVILPYREKARMAADFWESLFGTTEKQVRKHCAEGRFLGHFVFLNNVCLGPLAAVERKILQAAAADPAVKAYLDQLDIVYSFQRRHTKGYDHNVSLHSFGLALDLVPKSYEGKQVFWRWSRVFNRDAWHRIPLEKRWSPPQAVIDAFEAHGFIWGGKWAHFDTIHFEYRPEIIAASGLSLLPDRARSAQ